MIGRSTRAISRVTQAGAKGYRSLGHLNDFTSFDQARAEVILVSDFRKTIKDVSRRQLLQMGLVFSNIFVVVSAGSLSHNCNNCVRMEDNYLSGH